MLLKMKALEIELKNIYANKKLTNYKSKIYLFINKMFKKDNEKQQFVTSNTGFCNLWTFFNPDVIHKRFL